MGGMGRACVCVMINPLARQRVRNSCNIIDYV